MPITVIPDAQPSTGGAASDVFLGTSLAADNAAARRVVKTANRTFIAGMAFTFSAASCAYIPFILKFETNEPYIWLGSLFLVSIAFVAASASRIIMIVSQGQDREILFCKSVLSYDRQLNRANARAHVADINVAHLSRQNARLMTDLRVLLEGAADEDGLASSAIKPDRKEWVQ